MSEEEKSLFGSLFDSPEWKELQEKQQEWEKEFEQESEEAWNSLDKETQLKIFCAISRRIYKAELEDKGTYRHALYRVFNFGPEAYAPAQLSGYLSIHNAIYEGESVKEIAAKVAEFAESNGVDKEKIEKFILDVFGF